MSAQSDQRKAFRKKFCDGLERLYGKGLLELSGPAAQFQHREQSSPAPPATCSESPDLLRFRTSIRMNGVVVFPRSAAQRLAGLRLIIETLEQNRQSYDAVAFAQLTRILHRRIDELSGDLHSLESSEDNRPIEVCEQR
jgi:hypothetical protein